MRKHKSDRIISVLTFVLMAIGLVVIFAIGPQRANFMNSAYGTDYNQNYFFIHQLISVIISTAAFIIAFKLPYEKLSQYAKIIILVGLGMNAILAVLGWAGSSLVPCQLGGCRWINLGFLGGFQPAELLKLGLVLYLANLVGRYKKEGKLETRDFLQPYAIIAMISLFFVVFLQKDLGTGVAMVAIILAILYMSNIKIGYFLVALGILLAGGVFSIISSPHRMERMFTFSGEGNSDENYHIDNAKMAIGTGGFLGVGIGNSVQATGYLPESINDSVFAVMGETFGFVGLALIIGIFTILLFRILKTATKLETERSMVAIGVFAWVGMQMIVNIAAMIGLIPLTGITLPLLSYGGTSMMFIAFSLGLVSQLSCYTGREVKNESISSRRGIRGTYYTGSRGIA
ncbi:FtsW/RodA/SpoVE family cell cycle protein [Candidatus Saccharibacteria bacterium]|nr:FtsW/RodA/SpoVE family cell cycle protein [Candidatus Saccharibacteria bacterium]MBR3233508.1 FtsW/RodA/SpoVE family cell cycle protein [Candidatus Saccharibacteria bacterium]